jgi:outer membrane lipoprotein-sorting protein
MLNNITNTMKTKFSILIFPVLLIGFTNHLLGQDAATILAKADEVMYSAKDQSSKMKIILIDKQNREKVREANVLQKGDEMRLFRFTAPASQSGIAFLSLPDEIMYIYMPAFGKERRIASHVKNQSFAGTDFSYDDMEAKPFSEKYNPTLLITDGDYFVLELVPKPDMPSDYSKIIMKVDKSNYCPVGFDFYNKGDVLIKEGKYLFEKVGNYWSPKEITMKNLKKNHTTKMITSEIQYDTGLSDDEFTVRKLKQ